MIHQQQTSVLMVKLVPLDLEDQLKHLIFGKLAINLKSMKSYFNQTIFVNRRETEDTLLVKITMINSSD